ncbi:hypothetical protein HK101_005382 [Irineochytrium annulatum]|nr:hypothetical protein HK101_005382 [Irineochytrium annulatum]
MPDPSPTATGKSDASPTAKVLGMGGSDVASVNVSLEDTTASLAAQDRSLMDRTTWGPANDWYSNAIRNSIASSIESSIESVKAHSAIREDLEPPALSSFPPLKDASLKRRRASAVLLSPKVDERSTSTRTWA